MCVWEGMYVCTGMYTHTCIWGDQKSTLGVFYHSPTSFLIFVMFYFYYLYLYMCVCVNIQRRDGACES